MTKALILIATTITLYSCNNKTDDNFIDLYEIRNIKNNLDKQYHD